MQKQQEHGTRFRPQAISFFEQGRGYLEIKTRLEATNLDKQPFSFAPLAKSPVTDCEKKGNYAKIPLMPLSPLLEWNKRLTPPFETHFFVYLSCAQVVTRRSMSLSSLIRAFLFLFNRNQRMCRAQNRSSFLPPPPQKKKKEIRI